MFSLCRRLPRGKQLGLLFLWGLPRQDGMADRIMIGSYKLMVGLRQREIFIPPCTLCLCGQTYGSARPGWVNSIKERGFRPPMLSVAIDRNLEKILGSHLD